LRLANEEYQQDSLAFMRIQAQRSLEVECVSVSSREKPNETVAKWPNEWGRFCKLDDNAEFVAAKQEAIDSSHRA
jgi:hypothetical protein